MDHIANPKMKHCGKDKGDHLMHYGLEKCALVLPIMHHLGDYQCGLCLFLHICCFFVSFYRWYFFMTWLLFIVKIHLIKVRVQIVNNSCIFVCQTCAVLKCWSTCFTGDFWSWTCLIFFFRLSKLLTPSQINLALWKRPVRERYRDDQSLQKNSTLFCLPILCPF